MTVRQIQCLLCYLGFDPGAPDGKLGPNTLAAIRRFQAAAHLNVDGHPGPATQQALQEAVKKNFSTNSDNFPQNKTASQGQAQEAAGGVKMIKALSAPYGNVRFMPTGGISPANMEDYLSFPKVFACGGSWMVKKDLIQAGAFDRITELCRQAVQKKEEIRSCQK